MRNAKGSSSSVNKMMLINIVKIYECSANLTGNDKYIVEVKFSDIVMMMYNLLIILV